jgi:nucleoside-diphosphate-sugar epimerase
LTWNQIYQAVAEAAGAEARVIHIASDFICQVEPSLTGTLIGDKIYSVIFNNSKIKKLVPDFKATIPFNKGIKQTLSWFEAETSRMVINQETNRMMDRIINAYESRGNFE